MTVIEVKKKLLDKGLNPTNMAKTLIAKKLVDTDNQDSVRTMLTALLYGKAYYPALADTVKDTFKITIKRPKHLQPVREALKQTV